MKKAYKKHIKHIYSLVENNFIRKLNIDLIIALTYLLT